jgi:methylmalonyl-CoA mutase N-terminal domain/subunit
MAIYTRSGIPLKSAYGPADIKNFDYQKNLNSPGAFPYTRGRNANATGAWIQRELSGEGEPSRSNEQLKYLIEKGQMGVDVIGDSPTMALLDPDHPLALNTVGTQGVSLCCLQDYRELFRDLPLDRISVSSSVPPAFALAGLYLVAKECGFAPDKLRGSVLQAPFYAEDCGYAMHLPFPLRLRIACDCIEFCAGQMPKFHAFVEDTYFFSETGLNAIEEMALGFIEIRHIVRQLLQRGVDIDSFAPRIAILVNCSIDFFEEIAKIRATRRLFARMMKAEFGAQDPRSQAVVITSHTSYRTPSPESHLVGLRTQQVVHLESNIAAVQDPLGGSYFIESLTDEMEKRMVDLIEDIESKGDPATLSEKGWFKKFFENSMHRYYQQVGSGELAKVGVNVHQIPDHEDTLLKEISEGKIEPYRERAEKIKEYKHNRDSIQIKAVLQELQQSSKSENENILPAIITATKAGATMGEIAGVLRQAYDYPYDPHGLIDSPV